MIEPALLPGDFILVHGLKPDAKIIQFGQRLRFRGSRRRFAYWNHAALYIGHGTFIEAKGGHHARMRPASWYDDRHIKVVHVPCTDDAQRENAVRFAKSQLGKGYGYVTIVCLVFWCLFGGRITVGMSNTDICSGLVARATERMGVIYDRDPVTVMPAHLAEHFS